MTYTTEADLQAAARQAVIDSMNGSGLPVTADTKIDVVRILPGPNGVYDTGATSDDVVEENYTNGQRGDRVGIHVSHLFETPAPVLLRMFSNDGAPAAQNSIKMGATCFMEHE
jgi:hypothetical protein